MGELAALLKCSVTWAVETQTDDSGTNSTLEVAEESHVSVRARAYDKEREMPTRPHQRLYQKCGEALTPDAASLAGGGCVYAGKIPVTFFGD